MSKTSALVETVVSHMSCDDGHDKGWRKRAQEMGLIEGKRSVLYLEELKRRGLKFIPAQVMRPIFAREGLPVGPMVHQNIYLDAARKF